MIDAIEGMSAAPLGVVSAAPTGDGVTDARGDEADRGVAGAALGDAGGGRRVRRTQAKRSSGWRAAPCSDRVASTVKRGSVGP